MKNDGKVELLRKCSWLADSARDNIRANVCSINASSQNGIAPAKDVCKETCGVCIPQSTAPSSAVSSSPSSSPSSAPLSSPSINPSSAPSNAPCSEDQNARFFWKVKNDGKVELLRKCSWLANSARDNIRANVCSINASSQNGIAPAKDVCVVTCGICVP